MVKQKKVIGYLGPIGTFTELAVDKVFKKDEVKVVPFNTLPECLFSANKRNTDFTVVPIENSIGGSVNLTIDWLIHKINVPIQGEVRISIDQDLLVHKHNYHLEKRDFKIIYSHPQAISQCSNFLRKNYPKAELSYTESTAEAASIISKNSDQPWLAIANCNARNIYSLDLYEKEIQDYPTNTTRFVILGNEKLTIKSKSTKSSILLTLKEGLMLHQILEKYSLNGLELTKIESAPMKTEMGKYFYFLDYNTSGPNQRTLFDKCCKEIERLGCPIRRLGTYPCFKHQERKKILS
ncbi:prephenate dehydratase [Alteribacter populi]|uniref:prephenate dehydratase n=1 Tax=Alteribacter populi TaxID=2011011 RepID=UPI0012FFC411|nr:prephenate dehydratase [Alteribacter populi]